MHHKVMQVLLSMRVVMNMELLHMEPQHRVQQHSERMCMAMLRTEELSRRVERQRIDCGQLEQLRIDCGLEQHDVHVQSTPMG